MFRGINPVALDAKGRISIPSRYRQRLQELCSGQMVLTVDADRCLLLYPLPLWEDVEERLLLLSSTDRKARALKRLLLGHAEECGLDSNGRLLLPAPLREFAQIDKRVVMVGQGNKFELWDEATWYRQRDEWIDVQSESSTQNDIESLSF